MAGSDNQYAFPDISLEDDDTSTIISTRGLEAFGRKVTSTASQLMASSNGHPAAANAHYQAAMGEVHKQLRRPNLQRSVFAMARTTPTDLVRSKLSTREIQSRALAYVPEEMMRNLPADENAYSLFQGFQASFPEFADLEKGGVAAGGAKHGGGGSHRRRVSRGRKLLEETPTTGGTTPDAPHAVSKLRKERAGMMHELEMLSIRKNMASSEIREIDNKMANLAGMRRIILERLAGLEQEEALLEHDIVDVEGRLEEAQELADEAESIAMQTPNKSDDELENESEAAGFMSQSVYEKLPNASSASGGGNTPSKSRKPRNIRRKTMPILHEHFEPGTMIRSIHAHHDHITALDFDAPFGLMVSAAMDDSVRVWDLNAGRCIGFLEGHTASVRALQVEDNILATGSMDATIRLWDLSKARYDPVGRGGSGGDDDDDDGMAFENPDDLPVEPPVGTMADCPLFTLQAHVDEITALHFRDDVLVSGSADKTLRQWDLEKGRCVQTLDVMWAAAQASALAPSSSLSSSSGVGGLGGGWLQTTRAADVSADFVGALQVFESALACGTADGMVRLWDLRSGQVHRSLVGHTGPVTCLQFDDMHLVTGSLDRSVRIWDLRTGSIYDAYAYENPITSMMFDTRRIVCAAGEDVVKVYDKVEGRQWDCGAGVAEADDGGKTPAVVERVRLRDGYLVEGRKDGVVGVWTC